MGCCDEESRAKAFGAIDGTPVYYGRSGSLQPSTFYCTTSLYTRLVYWVRYLRAAGAKYGDSRFDSLSYLVSAGAQVCRNDGCISMHNYGRALDLDLVRYAGVTISPYAHHHASTSRGVRRRYLAIDASARRFFRYVLDGNYNSAHYDHIHVDDSAIPRVCLRSSRSDTVFSQQACNDFMGTSLTVDGSWGATTEAAFVEACARLNVVSDPHTTENAWLAWCARAAAHGIADKSFGVIGFDPV